MSHEHHADGRLRLASAVLVSIATTAIHSIGALITLLMLALFASVVVIARRTLSPDWLLRRLVAINIFVAWMWLVVAIDWPNPAFSETGIALASQISLRVNTLTLAVSLLLGRMSGIDLARASVGLGLPQSLGALIAFAVRAIALLAETRGRLEQAMRARAYRAKFGWRSIRVSAQLVTWLIIHALVRSERLELGLRARGLTSPHWSTRRHGHWNSLPRSEWLLFVGVSASLLLAVLLFGIRE